VPAAGSLRRCLVRVLISRFRLVVLFVAVLLMLAMSASTAWIGPD
jgi:hypothetical protein